MPFPTYDVRRMRLTLEPGDNQGPPTIVAQLRGTVVVSEGEPEPFQRTVELVLERGRYRIASSQGGVRPATSQAPAAPSSSDALGGVRLEDVAAEVGLDFRHAAFRFGVSDDETAMMGGGLCWLDYDDDGWLDLFVVNSYAESDFLAFERRGGLPRSALFRNVDGRFEDVSRESAADLPLRGSGCVAADFNLDGHTDLYVTTAGYNVPTDGYDALLWNNGDGTFSEGARAAGINDFGWHAGAAVGDLNEDGRPDLVVASYTDVTAPIASSSAGFPTNHKGQRDLLYLNTGTDANGRSTFREVGRRVGLETRRLEHGLGAVLTDVNLDGRLDLYVANDADPNRLYVNVATAGGLGFRFDEVARRESVDDPHAGMGIASADVSRDGRTDLFVTNARKQLHAAFRSRPAGIPGRWFQDARAPIAAVVGTSYTGWGASWVDLDHDTDLDLAFANGAIPVAHLTRSAQQLQVLENIEGRAVRARRPQRHSSRQRPWPRSRRLRQRRRRRPRGQLGRRSPPATGVERRGRALARGPARHLRPRHPDHRRLARRARVRARGEGGQQLPLVRGPARPLRPRRRHERQGTAGSLPGWKHCAPLEPRPRPDRGRRAQLKSGRGSCSVLAAGIHEVEEGKGL